MPSNKQVEQILSGDLVLHCAKVKVFQKIEDGIQLSGHGTIKINQVGALYLEFISTSTRNLISVRESCLPVDPLDVTQTLYLEVQCINGDVYKSSGFSLELALLSINLFEHYYIFLSYLINKPVSNQSFETKKSRNYLHLEFAEKFDIPTNKMNSTTSTLGGESYMWNEVVIEVNDCEISMVKCTKHTKIKVKGNFDSTVIKACLKFYIGFSGASMPQFYYQFERSENGITSTISSIQNNQKQQCSATPMRANIGDEEYKNNNYHYQLFHNIVKLCKDNPKYFESIYSQWERVWQSFQSSNSIMLLTLSVAIEGLLNDIYIPVIKDRSNNQDLNTEINRIKEQIKTLNLTDDHRNRLLGSVSYWKNVTAAKALEYLIDEGVITKEDKQLWTELRNESAHPKVTMNNFAQGEKEREKVFTCLNLFHKLILNILSYSGPIAILQPRKKEKHIKLEHIEIINRN